MTTRAPSTVLSTARPTGPHLTVAGELDAAGVVRLRALLDDAVAPGVRLTLDLSRVTHLSTSALPVLVQAHRRLRDHGGALVLEAVSEPVERVLRVSGLHKVLHVRARVSLAAAAQLGGVEAGRLLVLQRDDDLDTP